MTRGRSKSARACKTLPDEDEIRVQLTVERQLIRDTLAVKLVSLDIRGTTGDPDHVTVSERPMMRYSSSKSVPVQTHVKFTVKGSLEARANGVSRFLFLCELMKINNVVHESHSHPVLFLLVSVNVTNAGNSQWKMNLSVARCELHWTS